ncbi:hypothetical protein EsH8_IX_000731 [Colletotrichum jinshuiense]
MRKDPLGENTLKARQPHQPSKVISQPNDGLDPGSRLRLLSFYAFFFLLLLACLPFPCMKGNGVCQPLSHPKHRQRLHIAQLPIIFFARCNFDAATALLVQLNSTHAVRSVLSKPASLCLGPWSCIVGFHANNGFGPTKR